MPRYSIKKTSFKRYPRRSRYTRKRPRYSKASVPFKPEIKTLDTFIGPGAATALNLWNAPINPTEYNVAFGGLTYLNMIMPGNGYYERVGSKVTFRSITVSWTCSITAPNTSANIRSLIVYDRSPSGAMPALTMVINTYGNIGGGVQMEGGQNPVTKKRFSLLYDKTYNLNTSTSLTRRTRVTKRGRWESEFSTAAGTIADIQTGSFLFICFCDAVIGAPAPIIYSITSRMRYEDN